MGEMTASPIPQEPPACARCPQNRQEPACPAEPDAPGGVMPEFPCGCQHPMSAHCAAGEDGKEDSPAPLLPNSTPAPPGAACQGAPVLPLPSSVPSVHASFLWEAPGPCQMLPVSAGVSMGSRASGGEHPTSSCQRYRARGWSCRAWKGGWHGGQPSPQHLSWRENPREGQSPSEGWKCFTPP